MHHHVSLGAKLAASQTQETLHCPSPYRDPSLLLTNCAEQMARVPGLISTEMQLLQHSGARQDLGQPTTGSSPGMSPTRKGDKGQIHHPRDTVQPLATLGKKRNQEDFLAHGLTPSNASFICC
uniref:Uncharacterized protein n=1 Tax=Cyanoderma ruficeps TaxID=181631 RepID=A0A8C3P2L1_9PASS